MDEIWEYSKPRWGIARADRYIEAIEAELAKAAAGEVLLRPRDECGAGLFSLRSGSHVVFVRREQHQLVAIAVLHQMMEPSRHLREND